MARHRQVQPAGIPGSQHLVDAQGVLELPRASKLALARKLIAEIAARLAP